MGPRSRETGKRPPSLPPPRRPAGLLSLAGFGRAPRELYRTPAYALRVIVRSCQLHRSLAIARRHRSADAAVFEAALGCADGRALATGLAAVLAAGLGLVFFVVITLR